MKKVIVDTRDFETIGMNGISWLNVVVPKERKYVDERQKDMFPQSGKHIVRNIIYGKGFYFEDENDPLYVEFRTKFPNAKFRIED